MKKPVVTIASILLAIILRGETIMPDVKSIISGTYTERIAYSAALLAINQFWYQTDAVGDSTIGYYYWSGVAWINTAEAVRKPAQILDIDDTLTDTTAQSSQAATQESPTSSGSGVVSLIEDIELTMTAASFDFDNIPQTYKSLRIYASLRGAVAGSSVPIELRFNGVETADYYKQQTAGTAATASAFESLGTTVAVIGSAPAATAEIGRGATKLDLLIVDYTEDFYYPAGIFTAFQPTGTLTGTLFSYSGGFYLHVAGAVTRITISPDVGSWDVGSRATLYGID